MTFQLNEDILIDEMETLDSLVPVPFYNDNITEIIPENEEINITEGEAESFICNTDEHEEFIQPLHLNMRIVNEPPRISQDPSLPGYNPFRSDFDVEYDNSAESVLSLLYCGYSDWEPIENSHDERLIDELKIAVVEGYNSRLEERVKRKRIIREHGLINMRKVYSWRCRKEIEIGKDIFRHLIRFMQFTSCYQFDKLLASVHNYNSIRTKTNKVLNCRHLGLTTFKGNELYEKLFKLRQESIKTTCKKAIAFFSEPCQLRQPAPPLRIYNLPGFKQLNEAEVNLCSNLRIVPKDYLKFKQAMVTECSKTDGLKLALARALIKIDVNKTRKIFDFLIENGVIWKPKE